MMNIFDLVMILAVIVQGFLAMASRYRLARIVQKKERYGQYCLSAVMGIWTTVYVLVFLNEIVPRPFLDFFLTRSVIVRPLLLITLNIVYITGQTRRVLNGH